jgi:hypothetical protein
MDVEAKSAQISRRRDTSRGVSGSWLSPPAVALDANLVWLLRAAFADDVESPHPEDSQAVLELARRLEISGRIAERSTPERLSRLGALGQGLEADRLTNLAVESQLGQALAEVTGVAERHSIPAVGLKYAALKLARVIRPGSRVVGDLDLLVPVAAAYRLSKALQGSGFSKAGTRSHAHQLEALVGPYGAVVELHVHIPGVRIEAARLATADDLMENALVLPAEGTTLLVPSAPVLVAHAIAHGLLQNRTTPQSYSLLRMVADILDLRALYGPGLLPAAARFVPSLSQRGEAIEGLCLALSRGLASGPGFEGTEQQVLLWHCLAARLDKEYGERLRASGAREALGGSLRDLAAYLGGALFPTEHELDAIYGPVPSTVARLRRRWFRPVDLALRAARRWSRSR